MAHSEEWDADLDRQYAIYRDYLKHEDNLINHRTTWHSTWQVLLFGALGIVIQGKPDENNTKVIFQFLRFVLPAMGILTSVVGGISVWSAVAAINHLKEEWKKTSHIYYEKAIPIVPGLTGGGRKLADQLGHVASLSVPVVIFLAWVTVFIALYCQGHQTASPAPDRQQGSPANADMEKGSSEKLVGGLRFRQLAK